MLQDEEVDKNLFVYDDIAAMTVMERREYAKLPQSSSYFVAHGVHAMFVTGDPHQTELVTQMFDALETQGCVFVMDEADEVWGSDVKRRRNLRNFATPREEMLYELAWQRRHPRNAPASTLQSVFPGVHALVQITRNNSIAMTWHNVMQLPYTSMALDTDQAAQASDATPSKKQRCA